MSNRTLSKQDKQADFTRGGQITFHNIRMLTQVSAKVAKIGLIIFVMILCLGAFLFIDKQLFFSVFEYLKSLIYVFFNKGDKIVPSYFKGSWGFEYAKVMVNDPWYIHNKNVFWGILGSIALFGAIISSVITLLITRWLQSQGKEQSSDKFIRGMELVEPRKLTKALRKDNKLASTKLDNHQVMVKDFGVYQTLIDGTIGTGKSVLLMKFLKDCRKNGDRVILYDKGCSLTPFFYREGKDSILNPFDTRSKLWDVWSDGEELTDFQNIADALIPLHGQTDPFWVEAGRQIFVSTAYKMKDDPERSTYKLLAMLLTSSIADISSYLEGTDAATLVSENAQKMAISIKSILATYVKSMRFIAELEELKKDGKTFSIRDWVHNEKDNEGEWLFLTSNTRQHASMRPLISVWLTIASLALLELEPSRDRRIWFVVDEMPSLHAIPNLPETLAEVRKFGGCWVIGIQSYAQLRKTYGQDYAETIFDLLNTRFFFRSPSAQMAEISSKELGEQEVDVMKTQYSIGANTIRDGVSLGSQTMTKRVISTAEIMNLNNLQCYLRVAGDYPITRLNLKIDKSLKENCGGFMPFQKKKHKSDKQKAIELLIGDAMYTGLDQLSKKELQCVNNHFRHACDGDLEAVKEDFESHKKAINDYKEPKIIDPNEKLRLQLQEKTKKEIEAQAQSENDSKTSDNSQGDEDKKETKSTTQTTNSDEVVDSSEEKTPETPTPDVGISENKNDDVEKKDDKKTNIAVNRQEQAEINTDTKEIEDDKPYISVI
jgi:type IV conjugative transfer system coupling protein TraD